MPDQVPVHVARDRNRVLREIAAEKQNNFMQSFVGSVLESLTLPRYQGDRTEALTQNYLKLLVAGSHPANRVMSVRIDGVRDSYLHGAPVSAKQ